MGRTNILGRSCAPSSLLCLLTFQFDCTNTLNDQLLEKVTVQVEPSDSYEVLCCIPAPSLAYNQPGICYTLVRLPDDDSTTGTNPQEGRERSRNALQLELLNVWANAWGSGTGFFSRVKYNDNGGVFIFIKLISAAEITGFVTKSLSSIHLMFNVKH